MNGTNKPGINCLFDFMKQKLNLGTLGNFMLRKLISFRYSVFHIKYVTGLLLLSLRNQLKMGDKKKPFSRLLNVFSVKKHFQDVRWLVKDFKCQNLRITNYHRTKKNCLIYIYIHYLVVGPWRQLKVRVHFTSLCCALTSPRHDDGSNMCKHAHTVLVSWSEKMTLLALEM